MNNILSLENLINLQNPWFVNSGNVPSERLLSKRQFYSEFRRLVLETKQISALIGIRRVGKTVMVRQILSEILNENKQVCSLRNENLPLFFSFDQEIIPNLKNPLSEIIDFYLSKILRKKLSEIKDTVYLFFDEVQLVPFWQDTLKRYYDLNQNLKFVVSGSSSLFIREKSKESLAGRIFEQILPPLTFKEFTSVSSTGNFEDYLKWGSFFEEIELSDESRRKEYLKEWVLGKVLERDLPSLFRISDRQILRILYQVILGTTGQNVVLSKIASELEVSNTTITNYVEILENTLLLKSIFNLAGSFVRRERRLRKIYPASSNFLMFLPISPWPYGAMSETYAANFFRQKYKEVFFYKERAVEVDFIIPERETAIEVKYQEKIHPEDYRNLRLLLKKKKYGHGMLLTKSFSGKSSFKEGEIESIPISELEETSF